MHLDTKNFSGDIEFDNVDGRIDLHVNPEGHSSTQADVVRGIKTLSGGEKSYSAISLIMALWEVIKGVGLGQTYFFEEELAKCQNEHMLS